MKTSELIGPALDWAVSEAEGCSYCDYMEDGIINRRKWSTNWSQGGPIIEREHIGQKYAGHDTDGPLFVAWKSFGPGPHKNESSRYGPTPLIAAMRCYVASKLGDEVEIPEELL